MAFTGTISEHEDLSAGALMGDLLLLAPDEGTRIEVMVPSGDGLFTKSHHLELDEDASGELDLEALAVEGDTVWALGSHSRRRRTVDPRRGRKKNRKRLRKIDEESARAALFRFRLDPRSGELAGDIDRLDLRKLFEEEPILKPFLDIPSKENGIDLEGLAVRAGRLYLGFRGPVLRGNWLPVIVLDFDKPKKYKLRFIQLGGRGIRSLEAVRDGLLAIAGPVGDGDASYQLYFWDGEDTMPDHGVSEGRLQLLTELQTPPAAKAEGLLVLGEDDTSWELMVIFDSAPHGAPARLRVAKPALA